MDENLPQTPIKFKRIEIRPPRWDTHPEKTTTNNHNWRQGLFVIFTDKHGNEFDYMPRWEDLQQINNGKRVVEETNKELCKNINNKEGEWHSQE